MTIRPLMFRAYFGWPSTLSLVPYLVAFVSADHSGLAGHQGLAGVALPWTSSWNESVWLLVGLLLTWPIQCASLYKFAYASGADRVLLEALIDLRKRGRVVPGRMAFLRSICVLLLVQFGAAMTLLPAFEGKAGTSFAEGIFMWACFQTLTMATLCFLIDYKHIASGALRESAPSAGRQSPG